MIQLDSTAIARFWAKVNKDGPVIREELGPCWIWTASTTHGYGMFNVGQQTIVAAPRVSWIIHNGVPPKGILICHKCDNRPCCRPDHLFLGTHKDNLSDMAAKGRSTRGMKHASAKLTDADVQNILSRCQNCKRGEKKNLALEYGVGHGCITKIIQGERWSHINPTLPRQMARHVTAATLRQGTEAG